MPEIFFPPRALRTFVDAVSAQVGADNLFAVLEKSNPPPINADLSAARAMDAGAAARVYASLQKAMRLYYGRGARGMFLRIGAQWWPLLMAEAPSGIKWQMAFARLLPLSARCRTVLNIVARFLSGSPGDLTAHTLDLDLLLVDHTSPSTVGEHTTEPICWATLGLVREALRWADSREFDVTETTCRGTGARQCEFKIVIGG